MKPAYLKLKDKTILEFDADEGYYQIYHPELMPFILRDRMVSSGDVPDYGAANRNQTALMDFFSNRSLSIKRENAKSIMNALHISQKNGYETKYKAMILCKGLSVSDDYWITADPSEHWADVNVRDNPLHETIAQVALYGKSLTITGPIRTPELTGQGAYAKAWFRENGELYLYKASTKGGHEAETEAAVSSILDCTNVPHVTYTLTEKEGRVVTRCRNMCTDTLSIVDADDVIGWCSRNEVSFGQLVRNMNANLFYQTVVVDYLIANRDRHGANWGFYMDNQTGNLVGIHPLFDHNNAFAKEFMEDPTGGESLMVPGKSQKDAAMYAISHCDFRITKDIPKDIFPDKQAYQCFMKRACELGLFQAQVPSILQRFHLRPYQEYVPVCMKPDNRDEYEKQIATAVSSGREAKNIKSDKKHTGESPETVHTDEANEEEIPDEQAEDYTELSEDIQEDVQDYGDDSFDEYEEEPYYKNDRGDGGIEL